MRSRGVSCLSDGLSSCSLLLLVRRGHSWGVEASRVTAQLLVCLLLSGQPAPCAQQASSGLEDRCGSLQALYLAICDLEGASDCPPARCAAVAGVVLGVVLGWCWGAAGVPLGGWSCAGVVVLVGGEREGRLSAVMGSLPSPPRCNLKGRGFHLQRLPRSTFPQPCPQARCAKTPARSIICLIKKAPTPGRAGTTM